jgi:AraC-like DNA-binding protein
MPPVPLTVAATSTLAMVRAAEARGVPTSDLLEGAALSRAALEDPDTRLPGPMVLAIWTALMERTSDPALQLAAPTHLPFGAYRVIDYLVGASATVGEGVHRFARFFRLIADAVNLAIEESGDKRCLCIATADGGGLPPVYVDYVFAALVGRIRMRIRPELRVLRVELRRPTPESPAAYRRTFQADVRFGTAADRLCFDIEEWESPIAGADAALARILEDHARTLAQRLPEPLPGFEAEVRKALATAMPEGGSAANVARSLHVSIRTLQRRLAPTGRTFREVADTVRGRLAEEYLTDPSVSIAEVAFLLGFSDQSSFNRAFRRWTGQAPGQWRREHTAGPALAAPRLRSRRRP